jgi:CRP-like cAMP-binding protein
MASRPSVRSRVASESPTFDEASSRVPFLAALPPSERERLRPHAVIRRIARAQHVWNVDETSDELLFLIHGHVKLTRATESGREVILQTCAKGELLCGGLPNGGGRYCCAAVALHDDVDVVALPRRSVSDLLERSPAATRAFLLETARREKGLAQRIEELSSGHVERRVAALLVRLAEQVGVERPSEGTWLPIVLSRQDIADLCGTTLETAIRTMTRLRREGLVRSVKGGFVIGDRTRLAGLAHGRT